jgi:hypothetical protein
MNWGKGIILGMALFVLFITGMGVCMFMSPTDDYDHQYYEKGLTFNQDYNHEQQVARDHAQPLIEVAGDVMRFTFIEPVKGKITFVRPSDNLMDKIYQLDSGPGTEIDIPIGSINKGQWRLVIDWKSNSKRYLYYKEMFIK